MVNCPSISVGDIFKVGDKEIRILDINEFSIITTGTDKIACVRDSLDHFMESIKQTSVSKVPSAAHKNVLPDLSEEEMDIVNQKARACEELLRAYYPEWNELLRSTKKKPLIHEKAAELGITPRVMRRIVERYLKSGRDKYALIDKRKTSMKAGKHAVAVGGRPMKDGTHPLKIDKKAEEALAYALDVFKKSGAIDVAMVETNNMYYPTYEVLDGQVRRTGVLPPGQRLSYKQVYRYVHKHFDGSVVQYRKGAMDYRNNCRPLTGNAATDTFVLGDRYQMDECKLPVYVTSDRCPGLPELEPVLYALVDVFGGGIVVGAYVGWHDNSYQGFLNAMSSMMEPHENQLKALRCDFTCDETSFPSMVRPNCLLTDKGAEYRSKALQAACKEAGIKLELAPAGTGSAKGLIENLNMRVQHELRALLSKEHGLVDMNDPRPGTTAKEHAVYPFSVIRKLVYRIIIDINLTVIEDTRLTPEQIMAGCYTPAEIYAYEKNRSGSPVNINDSNVIDYMFAFLRQDKRFTIDRSGISYVGHDDVHWYIKADWFDDLLNDPSSWKKIKSRNDIRYDMESMAYVYVRYKGIVHAVPLAERRQNIQDYRRWSFRDFDEMKKIYKKQKAAKKEADYQRKSNRRYEMRQMLTSEEMLQPEIALKDRRVDMKYITDHTMQERRLLENDPDEAKNRVLRKIQTNPQDKIPKTADTVIDAEGHYIEDETRAENIPKALSEPVPDEPPVPVPEPETKPEPEPEPKPDYDPDDFDPRKFKSKAAERMRNAF